MSLGSDELNCYNSRTNNNTETKLGTFGLWEVLHSGSNVPSFVSVLLFVQELWQIYNVHEKSASLSRFIHGGQCCFKIWTKSIHIPSILKRLTWPLVYSSTEINKQINQQIRWKLKGLALHWPNSAHQNQDSYEMTHLWVLLYGDTTIIVIEFNVASTLAPSEQRHFTVSRFPDITASSRGVECRSSPVSNSNCSSLACQTDMHSFYMYMQCWFQIGNYSCLRKLGPSLEMYVVSINNRPLYH